MLTSSRCGRRAPSPAALLALVIAACAQSTGPTDEDIETLVTQRLMAGNDIWEVQGLHKFRGRRKDDGTYVADVAYEMVFRESYMNSFERLRKARGNATALEIMQPLVQKYGWWDKGRIVHEEDRFRFVKSGKGWSIPSE